MDAYSLKNVRCSKVTFSEIMLANPTHSFNKNTPQYLKETFCFNIQYTGTKPQPTKYTKKNRKPQKPKRTVLQ